MTTSPDLPSQAVLMTLAGLAYGDPGRIAGYLGEAALLGGDWSLAWLAAPPDPPVNFAYLAVNRRTAAAVLAIRGTYPNPFSPAYWDDGDEDSPFGDMVAWPGGGGAAISAGTAKALTRLLALTDAAGIGLETAVAALAPEAGLTTTGHSLGGTLAPVVALHLSGSGADRTVDAVSFAGMTPGDAEFAALFSPDRGFRGRVMRVYNGLDTVAYGWDRVFATHSFYEPAPKGGPVVAALLLATAARLDLGGYGYAPVGDPVVLAGTVRPPAIPCELIAYVFETLHQHMPDTYLGLLGAPKLPFSIGFGTVVLPRDHPAAPDTPGPHLPVLYLG